ncbi:GAF and ANTAR domain-containing protein [Actinoplanes nipponensis]|uniref:GAF and ANTAR domain-containing protein n=1 Tax=Actinoplanes nipponensis TaxID=135950 RepID=UPI001EF30DCF|nr:GAF and ANTAR domain-containing protein [Actinoplanes nipponensis]
MPGSGAGAAQEQAGVPGRRRTPAAVQTVISAHDVPPAVITPAGPLAAAATGDPSVLRAASAAVPDLGVGLLARGAVAATRGVEAPIGPHPVEVAGLLHELTARLLGADDVPQALDRLAAFAAGAVPGTLRCSVALIGEGGPPVLAASGTAAQALDDLQYADGDGPALEAARTRSLVTAPDLPSDPRWPRLAESARAEGVHSVVAIPMDVQRSSVGALSLFVSTPGGINPELLLTAMAVVNQAELLLGELGRREGRREGATVDRAAGVIIAQRGCGVQEAYTVLQETAQRLGLDRQAVAERLIAAAARNAD